MIDVEMRWEPGRDPLPAIVAAAARGLEAGGEHVLQLARDVVPLEQGTLERSGQVLADGLTAAVSFDTPYAVRQHEELDYQHAPGRTAKYLERALADGAPAVPRLIATQIQGAIGGSGESGGGAA